VKSFCVVNATFGAYYLPYQKRLLASLDKYWSGPRMIWTDELPKGSPPHQGAFYAFKLYAIKEAMEAGHEGIIWLDGGGYLTAPIEPLIEKIKLEGYYAVKSPELIYKWIGVKAMKYFGYTRETLKAKAIETDWRLIGGTPYGFDFSHDITKEFFSRWWSAMEAGMFSHEPGDSSEFRGHRHDEAIASMLYGIMGMKASWFGEFYSGDEKDSQPGTVIKSGYDAL
jgi:hypothetical protein